MGINMEMQDIWEILVNAFLFYLAFKAGQISVLAQQHKPQTEIQTKLEQVRLTGQRPVIKVEEIDGVFYAYDGNDFLAQGHTADELGRLIANRFPNKYHLARIEIQK